MEAPEKIWIERPPNRRWGHDRGQNQNGKAYRKSRLSKEGWAVLIEAESLLDCKDKFIAVHGLQEHSRRAGID